VNELFALFGVLIVRDSPELWDLVATFNALFPRPWIYDAEDVRDVGDTFNALFPRPWIYDAEDVRDVGDTNITLRVRGEDRVTSLVADSALKCLTQFAAHTVVGSTLTLYRGNLGWGPQKTLKVGTREQREVIKVEVKRQRSATTLEKIDKQLHKLSREDLVKLIYAIQNRLNQQEPAP
jgi:hypothetical protein